MVDRRSDQGVTVFILIGVRGRSPTFNALDQRDSNSIVVVELATFFDGDATAVDGDLVGVGFICNEGISFDANIILDGRNTSRSPVVGNTPVAFGGESLQGVGGEGDIVAVFITAVGLHLSIDMTQPKASTANVQGHVTLLLSLHGNT